MIINKAYRMLGFIIRSSKEFDDPYTTKQLYCTFVRPILEFSSEVWCQFYQVHKNRIESIQMKFLKFALRNLGWNSRFVLPSYGNRLMLINMKTLEKRREVAAVMFLFKLLKGLIKAPKILAQCNYYGTIRNYNSNSNQKFFVIKTHRTKYGTYHITCALYLIDTIK